MNGASSTDHLIDWLPGAASGAVQVLCGHPFDTVKTRSQALNNASSLNAAISLYQQSGVRAFYRGALPPVIMTASKRGIQLVLWERLTPFFNGNTYAAGAITGGMGTIISCPLHVVKITAQTSSVTPSSLAAAKAILIREGVRGFYRGFAVHVTRDSAFASTYLGTYGYMRDGMLPPEMPGRIAVAAVGASLLTWTVLQPFDTLKTMAQLKMPWWEATAATIRSLDRQRLRYGAGRAWRGVGAAVMRAGPVNAISMTVYEWAKSVVVTARQVKR